MAENIREWCPPKTGVLEHWLKILVNGTNLRQVIASCSHKQSSSHTWVHRENWKLWRFSCSIKRQKDNSKKETRIKQESFIFWCQASFTLLQCIFVLNFRANPLEISPHLAHPCFWWRVVGWISLYQGFILFTPKVYLCTLEKALWIGRWSFTPNSGFQCQLGPILRGFHALPLSRDMCLLRNGSSHLNGWIFRE